MPNYNELGVKERAALIRAGVQNGLTRLNEIRNTYSAGALTDALYEGAKKDARHVDESSHYSDTISEDEM